MSAPYSLSTPAQIRAFHLLTLAQMAHLESVGIQVTHTSAKRQAMTALDERDHYTPAADLIRRLRTAAHASVGLEQKAPEAGPPPFEPSEAVRQHAVAAADALRRLIDPETGAY